MNKSTITLLIKNNQDLIFKSKNSFVIGKQKQKEKQLNNSFSSNSVKSQLTWQSWHLCPETSTEIGNNPKLSNFIKLYFDLSSKANYLSYSSDQINLEKAKSWVKDGARIVGGCCGVGVEEIKAISILKD